MQNSQSGHPHNPWYACNAAQACHSSGNIHPLRLRTTASITIDSTHFGLSLRHVTVGRDISTNLGIRLVGPIKSITGKGKAQSAPSKPRFSYISPRRFSNPCQANPICFCVLRGPRFSHSRAGNTDRCQTGSRENCQQSAERNSFVCVYKPHVPEVLWHATRLANYVR